MPITTTDVKKIAELARLELTGDEIESFSRQLTPIIDYIDKLNELDVQIIDEGPVGSARDSLFEDVRRDDRSRPGLGQGEAVKNAPDTDGAYFKVPKVIGG